MQGLCRAEFLELTYSLPTLDKAGSRKGTQTETAKMIAQPWDWRIVEKREPVDYYKIYKFSF